MRLKVSGFRVVDGWVRLEIKIPMSPNLPNLYTPKPRMNNPYKNNPSAKERRRSRGRNCEDRHSEK